MKMTISGDLLRPRARSKSCRKVYRIFSRWELYLAFSMNARRSPQHLYFTSTLDALPTTYVSLLCWTRSPPFLFHSCSGKVRANQNESGLGRDWKRTRNDKRQTEYVSFRLSDAKYPTLSVQCDSSVSFFAPFRSLWLAVVRKTSAWELHTFYAIERRLSSRERCARYHPDNWIRIVFASVQLTEDR